MVETTQEAVCECRVLISKRETGTETITAVGETTEVADLFILSCFIQSSPHTITLG